MSEKSSNPNAAYSAVRIALMRQGVTFRGWCSKQGICRQYAERALKGLQAGPKAQALKKYIQQTTGGTDD